jgi:predicted RNA-binding Zn-ribbon protein involved in translation (DUF1610 family)
LTNQANGRPPDHNNPFQYGTTVTGRSFAGRDEELEEAFQLIKAGKNVLIQSERRMGKSSFLAELARRHLRDFVFIHLDLFGITDETRFLELMTRGLMATYQGRGGAFEPTVWEMLRSTRLKLAILEQEQLAKPGIEDGGLLLPPSKDIASSNGDSRKRLMDIQMCPKCEKPLKWVEKYGKFYCYNCKKYLSRQRRVKKSILVQDSYQERTCPLCGDDTSFVERYSEYYCENCNKYPFVRLRRKVSEKFTQSDMTEVFELPQTIASDRRMPVVVMFDESQELAAFENHGFLRAMKARCDLQADVTYVFAGNKGDELTSMFDDRDGPFQKFAHPIELGPIPDDEMEKFLMDKFRSAEGRLDRLEARRIIALSGRCPYYIQQIAHELMHISKEPTAADLETALDLCIALQSHAYKQLWESVKSPLHRRYLIAAVSEPRASHGAEFVNRHGLKSRSHVQRIEKQLEARGLVSDGEVVDPMFVLWLRAVANLR